MRAEEISKRHVDTRIGSLLDFWRQACGSHAMPSQADLDLVNIPRLLPNVFLIDAEDNGEFRYRYVGTSIDTHLGVSLTGKAFSEYRTGRLLEEISTFFIHIIKNAEMGILTTKLPSEAHGTVVYTRVGLPIADDHKTPNKVLGLLFFENSVNPPMAKPYVFDLKNEENGIVKSVFGTL